MKTFNQSLAHWLALRSLHKRPKTQEFYSYVKGIISKHWQQPELPADSITPELLLSFAQDVAHVCPSVWNQIVSALRFISPHASCLPRRKLNVRDFSPPSQALFEKFLADVDANPRTQAGLIVRFLCLTGLRKGEAFALRWENVLSDCIVISSKTCKSGKTRSVPFLPGMSALLVQLRALDKDNSGFVLPRGNPRKAIEAASLRVAGAQWSLHCFRHMFATACIEQSVDVPTVAKWLGHQDQGVTLTKTYFHLVDEHSRRMAERVRMFAPVTPVTPVNLAALVRAATIHIEARL